MHLRRRTLCMLQEKVEKQAEQPATCEEGNGSAPAELHAGVVQSSASRFFEKKYFPIINKLKIPLFALWVVLFGVYIGFAATLKPDPNPPELLPDDDPYKMWTERLLKHFAAVNNPMRVNVQIWFGLDPDDPINREGTTSVRPAERGVPNWKSLRGTDGDWAQAQNFLVSFCEDLRAKAGGSDLMIATSAQLNRRDPVTCLWSAFKSWAVGNGHVFPVATYVGLRTAVAGWLAASNPDDPTSLNYDTWKDNIFFQTLAIPEAVTGHTVDAKAFMIQISLTAQIDDSFEDGMLLYDRWSDYVQSWRARPECPSFLGDTMMLADGGGAFHYYKLQDVIIEECFGGIRLALILAFFVLLIATMNIVVAVASILCISSIVTSVMAFAVWNGWSLGVLEAIIFVMVIGLSVDYVVHLADAYLEAMAEDRTGRTAFMLSKMGMSVLSGASTTLGASAVMCLTYIVFFKKFGMVILFTVAQSLFTALVFFSAMMALFGPQGNFGNLIYYAGKCKELRNSSAKTAPDESPS